MNEQTWKSGFGKMTFAEARELLESGEYTYKEWRDMVCGGNGFPPMLSPNELRKFFGVSPMEDGSFFNGCFLNPPPHLLTRWQKIKRFFNRRIILRVELE